MAIKSSQGYVISSTEPIDSRFIMTKAEMLAIKKARMPDYYFVVCKDDKKLYIYDKSIEQPSAETGRFVLVDNQIFSNVRFTTLETKVGDAEAGTGLAGDVKTLQTDVTTLKTDVNTLKPEVAQLKQEVENPESGLLKRIQALEGRLTTAETRMTEIETRIASIRLDNISGTISGEEVA